MLKTTLVYDAGCSPCTRFMRIIDFLDARGKLDFASLIDADAEGRLDSIPESRRHRSFHLILPHGEILSGAKAVPNLVSLLPLGRATSAIMVSAPFGTRSISFVYGVLSRLHDSGSCTFESRPAGRKSMKRVGAITPDFAGDLFSRAAPGPF